MLSLAYFPEIEARGHDISSPATATHLGHINRSSVEVQELAVVVGPSDPLAGFRDHAPDSPLAALGVFGRTAAGGFLLNQRRRRRISLSAALILSILLLALVVQGDVDWGEGREELCSEHVGHVVAELVVVLAQKTRGGGCKCTVTRKTILKK